MLDSLQVVATSAMKTFIPSNRCRIITCESMTTMTSSVSYVIICLEALLDWNDMNPCFGSKPLAGLSGVHPVFKKYCWKSEPPDPMSLHVWIEISMLCLVNVVESLDDCEKSMIVTVEILSNDSDESKGRESASKFEKLKAHKSTIEAAKSEFNRKPVHGIKYVISSKLVENMGSSAQFLRNTPNLDKAMIGDSIGQLDEFLVVKIDRIMENIAERCSNNPGLFKNADTAYVLAYAAVLLNSDAHNPLVSARMSKAEFYDAEEESAPQERISWLDHATLNPSATATVMQGSNQISKSGILQSLRELAGKPTEQVILTSVCNVSVEKLRQYPAGGFSLQKLVEISYCHMACIRMVWARIWSVLATLAGSHPDEIIAMYAIDSLRQLGMKYLERAELANFTFHNDILKPFVVLMRSSRSESIRRLIVDCIVQMIKYKVGNIKSGWQSVFMIFTAAADDDMEQIVKNAFERVEQVVLEHFNQLVGDCFLDCVNCLIGFANNKASHRISLKAIALLRICEDRLAEGLIPGGSLRPIDISDDTISYVTEHYWFPMLAGLSDLTSDPRPEVRNCALEVLYDFLNERGAGADRSLGVLSPSGRSSKLNEAEGLRRNQTIGQKFMDGIFTRSFSSKPNAYIAEAVPSSPSKFSETLEPYVRDEEESSLLLTIWSKCIVQLLLLGAVDSIQWHHQTCVLRSDGCGCRSSRCVQPAVNRVVA